MATEDTKVKVETVEYDSDLETSLGEIITSDVEPENLKKVAAEGLALLHKTPDSKQSADEAAIKFLEVENELFANFSTVIQNLDTEISRLKKQVTPPQEQIIELERKKQVFTGMEKRIKEIITKRHKTKGGARRRRRRHTKRRKAARRKRRTSKK